jgi:hypothetical protein
VAELRPFVSLILFAMRLSQAQLKLLAVCPRKFQHIYIDQVAAPTSLEQVARMTMGSQFHLVMQQSALGLPIAAMLGANEQLRQWFEAFQQGRDQILRLDDNEQILWQQSEHLQTIQLRQHVITVVYDWVMVGATQAQILDWKTYPKPKQSQYLQAEWQTRLYLYVLAETHPELLPEQLSMTYWFFQAPTTIAAETPAVQSVRIRYSSAQHETTQKELQQMLQQLTDWLAAYTQTHQPLPQVAIEQGLCTDCAFAQRCGRLQPANSTIGLDAIEEVAI